MCLTLVDTRKRDIDRFKTQNGLTASSPVNHHNKRNHFRRKERDSYSRNPKQRCQHNRGDCDCDGAAEQGVDDGRTGLVDDGVVGDQKNIDSGGEKSEKIEPQSGVGVTEQFRVVFAVEDIYQGIGKQPACTDDQQFQNQTGEDTPYYWRCRESAC